MKFFKQALSGICLMLAAGVIVLRAQTNAASPASQTNATAAVVHKKAPAEVQPTEINSDSGQFYLKSNVFVYRGNVHVDNPQMKLSCGLLTLEAPKLAEGKYNRATALTNVVIDWVDDQGASNHATSDKAVYTYVLTNEAAGPEKLWVTNATVVLSGNPVVTNAQYTYIADPIIWDRINDSITSTNMLRTIVNPTSTNTSDLLQISPATKTGLFDTSIKLKTNATPQ